MQTMPMSEVASTTTEVRRHALDYWNADGLPTIFRAASYLLFGGLYATLISLFVVIRDAELGMVLFFLGLPAAAFAGAWFAYRSDDAVEWLKQRLTYPRTGYAAPPSQWKKAERVEAFDASFGRFSGVARFLRTRWLLFYGAWVLLGLVNDIFDHPFHLHPSLRSKELFLLALGVVAGGSRIPGFLRNKLVAVEVFGYPALGFLAARALDEQRLVQFIIMVGFAPACLVLLRGVVTFISYVQRNPLPPA
jgi:hypothetical protein